MPRPFTEPRQQALLPGHGGAPTCAKCTRRSAQAHPIVGFYARCMTCRRQGNASQRTYAAKLARVGQCSICRMQPPGSNGQYCDGCKPDVRAAYRRTRAKVMGVLGSICVCVAVDCFHVGACPITAASGHEHLLTVEHTLGDGGRQRSTKMDGTRRTARSRSMGGRGYWGRYLRAIQTVADHGMVLLCFNCHQHTERAKRAAARAI